MSLSKCMENNLIAERDIKRVRWEKAISRCMAWATDGSEERENIDPGEYH